MSEARPIKVSSNQMDFLKSEKDYTLFCGGLGSGKTHAGALWAITMALKHPKVIGLITANSYSQLKKATLIKFFELMDEMEIRYEYKQQEGIVLVGPEKTKVFCLSMEKYDLLRGIEFGWGWGDECAFYKEEAFNVMAGRIRSVNAPCQWKGTTTPNGFNWLYDKFVVSPSNSSHVVYSKTSENAAYLRKSYIEDLQHQYDSKLAEQELDGQFVNLTSGKVYYQFDRRKNVKSCSDLGGVLYVGLDFNVHPLCGVYCSFVGDKLYIFDEIYQEDSNTFKVSKHIKEQYPPRYVRVICDQTANRRRTSSVNTDHGILANAGFEVVKFKNPFVKDRDNNVNRLFEQNRIIIDPSCKKLILNLEQLVHDNDNDMLGHITDALAYVAWHFDPMKRPRRPASVRHK